MNIIKTTVKKIQTEKSIKYCIEMGNNFTAVPFLHTQIAASVTMTNCVFVAAKTQGCTLANRGNRHMDFPVFFLELVARPFGQMVFFLVFSLTTPFMLPLLLNTIYEIKIFYDLNCCLLHPKNLFYFYTLYVSCSILIFLFDDVFRK